MRNQAALLVTLAALAAPLGASPVVPRASSTPSPTQLPAVVYRGDLIPPTSYMASGGIPPEFSDKEKVTAKSFSLFWHNIGTDYDGFGLGTRDFRSAYAATSSNFSPALAFAVANNPEDFGWMYRIHATPNMVDLVNSGFKPLFGSEAEFAALGGIRWDQVEAWLQIPKNVTKASKDGPVFKGITSEELERWETAEAFFKQFPDLKWVDNPDYNPAYSQYRASEGQPQLAGKGENLPPALEQNAVDFMNRVGAAVGWKGKFPLVGPAPAAVSVDEERKKLKDHCAKSADPTACNGAATQCAARFHRDAKFEDFMACVVELTPKSAEPKV
ncbi:hypothetical protein RJ55_01943 [Drechmeria coniospora]|nr:hypothetical protein RJ55_01943 [Drechmeria coniospora]